MNWQCSNCGNVQGGTGLMDSVIPAVKLGTCLGCKRKRQLFRPVGGAVTGATDPAPGNPEQGTPGNPPIRTRAVARGSDPPTSWEAARSIAESDLRESQQQVLAILRKHGPLTDEGIYRYVNGEQSLSGARTRRSELVEAGYVRDTGKRAKTAAGRRTIVWEALESQHG